MDKHIWKFDTESEYQEANTPPPYIALVDNEIRIPISIKDYEFIDMGTSVLWATKNLGAADSISPGMYFQAGDVAGYPEPSGQPTFTDKLFDISDYKWGERYKNGKETLDPEDDAANVLIGKGARLPTIEEFEELIEACDVTVKDAYYWVGCEFVSKKDPTKRLIFSECGIAINDLIDYNDSGYMTSAFSFSYVGAFMINMKNKTTSLGFSLSTENYYGYNIRPVLPK